MKREISLNADAVKCKYPNARTMHALLVRNEKRSLNCITTENLHCRSPWSRRLARQQRHALQKVQEDPERVSAQLSNQLVLKYCSLSSRSETTPLHNRERRHKHDTCHALIMNESRQVRFKIRTRLTRKGKFPHNGHRPYV